MVQTVRLVYMEILFVISLAVMIINIMLQIDRLVERVILFVIKGEIFKFWRLLTLGSRTKI